MTAATPTYRLAIIPDLPTRPPLAPLWLAGISASHLHVTSPLSLFSHSLTLSEPATLQWPRCGLALGTRLTDLQVVLDQVHAVVPGEASTPLVLDHPGELVLEDLATRAAGALHLNHPLASVLVLNAVGQADLLCVAVPAPVHARLGALRIVDDLGEALAASSSET